LTHPTESFPIPAEGRRVLEALAACRRPLIFSHIRLDGDALGAELALHRVLSDRGAQPHTVNDGPIPEVFRFLPGVESVGVSPADLRSDYDLAVALDIASRERAFGIFKALPLRCPVVAVDHHPPVAAVGDPEWKDHDFCSTGEMVYHLVRAAGWRIAPEAATCLYAAIVTDTGRCTFPNTTSRALRVLADLMDLGADWLRVMDRVYQQEPFSRMALRAECIRSARFFHEGRIAVMTLSRDVLQRFGVDPIDLQDFSEIPRTIAGVEVGVLLREMEHRIKVSLRARKGVNIEPVARRFGGGGHHAAAGCEIAEPMDTTERLVLDALAAHLGYGPKGAPQ